MITIKIFSIFRLFTSTVHFYFGLYYIFYTCEYINCLYNFVFTEQKTVQNLSLSIQLPAKISGNQSSPDCFCENYSRSGFCFVQNPSPSCVIPDNRYSTTLSRNIKNPTVSDFRKHQSTIVHFSTSAYLFFCSTFRLLPNFVDECPENTRECCYDAICGFSLCELIL